jgi:hypothetical protein
MNESDGEVCARLVVGGAKSTQAGRESGGMPLSVGRIRPDKAAFFLDVLGPDGKLARRRATQRTVPGRALLGETSFPTGELIPIPNRGEGVAEMPPGAEPRWRVYRSGS